MFGFFFVPVKLVAKILLQEVWRANHDWDDALSPAILQKWETWTKSFKKHKQVDLPRCITPATRHLFSDASETGYGAVAYFRFERDSEVKISFMMAKSRVAPLKLTTISRLELLGALFAVRLANTIRDELHLPIDSTQFHTDSITVLRWMKSTRCRFNTYVGSRISRNIGGHHTGPVATCPG